MSNYKINRLNYHPVLDNFHKLLNINFKYLFEITHITKQTWYNYLNFKFIPNYKICRKLTKEFNKHSNDTNGIKKIHCIDFYNCLPSSFDNKYMKIKLKDFKELLLLAKIDD